MKNNIKGFMMAELIVVASIVLIVLATLYASYSKLYGIYNKRVFYHDADCLYRLGYYRDILIENSLINNLLVKTKENGISTVYDYRNANSETGNLFKLPASDGKYEYNDVAFIIYTNKKSVSSDALKNQTVNLTFKEYVTFLSTSTKINSNYLMIIERCKVDDKDNCNYAYLEIYDGKE